MDDCRLNENVNCELHAAHLDAATALDVVAGYDVVLDCTDNPATRYLVSDACVLLGKPLVSASALRTEGQLMVLNDPPLPPGEPGGGPCYRCVFPKPPPPESVVSCGEGGILGPVVGTMGVLQALEAIKIITRREKSASGGLSNGVESGISTKKKPSQPSLLLFSAYSSPQFRSIRLRPRRNECAACSSVASVTREALSSGFLDYVQFCGASLPVNMLSPTERVSARDLGRLLSDSQGSVSAPLKDYILVDTRDDTQFGIASIDGSLNIPFSDIDENPSGLGVEDSSLEKKPSWLDQLQSLPRSHPIYVVCRLGNDSQIAVRKMKELGLDRQGQRWIGDIRGGLKEWRNQVDPDFPDY